MHINVSKTYICIYIHILCACANNAQRIFKEVANNALPIPNGF